MGLAEAGRSLVGGTSAAVAQRRGTTSERRPASACLGRRHGLPVPGGELLGRVGVGRRPGRRCPRARRLSRRRRRRGLVRPERVGGFGPGRAGAEPRRVERGAVAIGAGEVAVHGCGPAAGWPGGRRWAIIDYRAPRSWASTAGSSPAALVSMAGRTSAGAIAGSEAWPAGGLVRWRAGSGRAGRESLHGRAGLSEPYQAPQPTGGGTDRRPARAGRPPPCSDGRTGRDRRRATYDQSDLVRRDGPMGLT
jgi:hypothetical protein